MKSDWLTRRAPVLVGALVVWLIFEALQAGIVIGLGTGTTPAPVVAAVFALHALAWTIITLGIFEWASLLAPRFSRPVALGGHIVAFVIVAALDAFVRRAVSELFIGPPSVSFQRTMLYYADVTALSYIVALWVGKVVEARQALVMQSRHELALRSHLAQARLSYLHAQLQPHFLFNALGTVSELIFESPAAAKKTFRQLLAVLRAAASRDVAEIPLEEEIDVLLPYLEVQRTRFSDWLEIDLDIADDVRELRVPPLILQPLVENSLRHGLRGRSSRGRISISAHREESKLILSVTDNGAGLSANPGTRRAGVGLANTEERLRTLYGDDAAFRLFNDQSGATVAQISMPARAERSVSAAEATEDAATIGRRNGFAQRHPALAIATGCLVAAVLWTQQSYAYMVMSGRLGDTTLLDLVKNDFVLVAAWAAMVPAAAWMARRVPVAGRRWIPATLLHLCAVLGLGLLHSLVAVLYRSPSDLGRILSTFRGSFTVTLLVYLGVLAYSQRRVFEEWLAERQVAALRINAEITEARIAAASMSVSPESLDFTLRELERYADSDPLEAERAIARLGSELRSTLETAREAAPRQEASDGSGSRGAEDRVERLAMRA
jgi:two-component system LytT family sensor kinase